MQGSKSNACVSTDGTSFTLNAMHGHDVHAVAVAFPINTLTLGGRPDAVNDKRMTMGVGENGDPQFTLQAAHSHAVAVGFNWQNGGGYGNANDGLGITVEGTGPLQRCNTPAVAFSDTSATLKGGSGERGYPDPSDGNGHSLVAHALRGEGFDASEDGTGRGTPLVPVETLPQQGYDAFHASTQETNAVATLRTLRSQIGEEAFAAWGLGILDSLQPQEVLRARLHGLGIRCATFSRSWPIDCAISRKEDCATWAMQSVREAQGEGCPSPGWQLPQQLAAELGAYLSELPRPGAQTERFVRDLWLAGERIGFLREALSAFQETRRPAHREGQSALHTMQVRRLTATECEFLQGFPRNYTLIPWRKKQAEDCPDGPRYKALGNSMAVNCMAWIGERIAAVDAERNKT
jgi:DNA (cytosine-5)-methyltransferase 1